MKNDFESDFFKNYRKAIAKISINTYNDHWFSTYLCSKNRFAEINIYTAKIYKEKNIQHLLLFKIFVSNILKSAKYLVGEFFKTLLIQFLFFNKIKYFYQYTKQKQTTVILTFAYDHCFKDQFSDVFFNNLSKFATDNNKNVTTVYQLMGNFTHTLKSRFINDQVFSPYCFLTPLDVFKATLNSLQGFFTPICNDSNDFLTKLIKIAYLVDALSPAAIRAELLSLAMQTLTKKANVERIIFIYEGNFWERLVIKRVKKSSPKTILIGHQHNVLCPAALNYFPYEGEEKIQDLWPTKIITTGNFTLETLSNFGSYPQDVLISGCALRYKESLETKNITPNPFTKTLLVALEGCLDSLCLIDYILNQSDYLKDYQIIIRTHPMLPKEIIQVKNKYNLDKYRNISFSTTPSLLEEVKKSGAVLYWGTTVALEAILQGVPIIHLTNDFDLLSPDPLFNLFSYKWIITHNDNLNETLNLIKNLEPNLKEKLLSDALRHIDQYFHPVNQQCLMQFIS